MKKKPKKSLEEINELSRQLKRARKRKGLPSGSRFNVETAKNRPNSTDKNADPRIGSKKPVPLIVAENSTPKTPKAPKIKSLPTKKVKINFSSPEQELEHLENDANLEHLLDLVEKETPLTSTQQTELDDKLNRIEELMQQLGYLDNDDEELDENKRGDNIVSLLKG